MATTEDGYIDVSDDDTYEAFDNYLAKGQELAMDVEEGLHDARQLTIQVREGELTAEEYYEDERIQNCNEAIRAFDQWASSRTELNK